MYNKVMIGLICPGDRWEEGDKVERCCKQGEKLERSFKQVEKIGECVANKPGARTRFCQRKLEFKSSQSKIPCIHDLK
jgi:hypothetical protein